MATPASPALVLDGVTRAFGGVRAVDDVSLAFGDGELTALLGPSGCGKTTLLRVIAGLERPDRGTLLHRGENITAEPACRRGFGMVFQSFALFPHLDVRDNVAYALAIAGVARDARRRRAAELLDLVKLSGFARRRIGELSGGQRQRVAIARALAQEPRVFLLDEPMSALDAQLREEMQVELRLLQRELGITTVVVTHDQREAMTMADRIVVMAAGRVVQSGAPQSVYAHPDTRFVAGFIGKSNFLDGIVRGGRVDACGTLLDVAGGPGFHEGAAVAVACRPEAARLLDARAAADDVPNRLRADVVLVRDVGASREVFLDAGSQRLTCEMHGGQFPDLRAGERVTIELPAAALRLFPRETTA